LRSFSWRSARTDLSTAEDQASGSGRRVTAWAEVGIVVHIRLQRPRRSPVALFGILIFVASSAGCLAQNYSAEYAACMESAQAQDQMHHCASDEAGRADVQLNSVYKSALATMSRDRVATAKLKAFEQAWIAYRDAYIDAMYPARDKQAYGTITPMEIDLLAAELTRDQIKTLKSIQQFYKDNQ
jgi:uncharacterized protein YecT (DUF1311 family)